jgi:hypothetical protein
MGGQERRQKERPLRMIDPPLRDRHRPPGPFWCADCLQRGAPPALERNSVAAPLSGPRSALRFADGACRPACSGAAHR